MGGEKKEIVRLTFKDLEDGKDACVTIGRDDDNIGLKIEKDGEVGMWIGMDNTEKLVAALDHTINQIKSLRKGKR